MIEGFTKVEKRISDKLRKLRGVQPSHCPGVNELVHVKGAAVSDEGGKGVEARGELSCGDEAELEAEALDCGDGASALVWLVGLDLGEVRESIYT